MAEGDTWMNALLGAVVTIVASPVIPFAPIAGGAVAGYLEGGESGDGLRVGTYAGVIALIPAIFFGFLIATIAGGLLVGFGGLDGLLVGGFGVFLLFVLFIFGLIYIVGLSILGGWVGVYLKTETDL